MSKRENHRWASVISYIYQAQHLVTAEMNCSHSNFHQKHIGLASRESLDHKLLSVVQLFHYILTEIEATAENMQNHSLNRTGALIKVIFILTASQVYDNFSL